MRNLIAAILLIPLALSAQYNFGGKFTLAGKFGFTGSAGGACSTTRETKTGATTGSATWDGSFPQWASKFSASATYTACKAVLRLSQSGGTDTMRVGVFADSAGEPGAQVGSWSDSINVTTATGSEGDVTFSNMSASLTSGNTYWLVLESNGTGLSWYYYSLPGTSVFAYDGTWAEAVADSSFKYTVYSN